jgi:hypothetical protein
MSWRCSRQQLYHLFFSALSDVPISAGFNGSVETDPCHAVFIVYVLKIMVRCYFAGGTHYPQIGVYVCGESGKRELWRWELLQGFSTGRDWSGISHPAAS